MFQKKASTRAAMLTAQPTAFCSGNLWPTSRQPTPPPNTPSEMLTKLITAASTTPPTQPCSEIRRSRKALAKLSSTKAPTRIAKGSRVDSR